MKFLLFIVLFVIPMCGVAHVWGLQRVHCWLRDKIKEGEFEFEGDIYRKIGKEQ